MVLIYKNIFNKLQELGITQLTEYKKYKNPPYMDLSVDILNIKDEDGNKTIAMAHNYIQNGDVMADPNMEVKIFPELKMAEALTYQQDGLGIFQRVYPGEGRVDIKLKKELNQFLSHWLTNLKTQGFKKEA